MHGSSSLSTADFGGIYSFIGATKTIMNIEATVINLINVLTSLREKYGTALEIRCIPHSEILGLISIDTVMNATASTFTTTNILKTTIIVFNNL